MTKVEELLRAEWAHLLGNPEYEPTAEEFEALAATAKKHVAENVVMSSMVRANRAVNGQELESLYVLPTGTGGFEVVLQVHEPDDWLVHKDWVRFFVK